MKMGSVFKKTFGGSHLKNPNYKRLSVADHDAEESVGIIYRAGYVPFYVGEEEKRYQVPVKFLRFPPFRELMKQSYDHDVYDIKINGPIKLACTPKAFEETLKLAKKL
ncbi:hypothetical protein AB3S75_032753 [Citrus x aurantiifolia]